MTVMHSIYREGIADKSLGQSIGSIGRGRTSLRALTRLR